MKKYTFLFVILLCPDIFAQESQTTSDVRVIASDDRGITLEVRPVYLENLKIVSSEGTFEVPQFNSSFSRISNEAGREDIRTRLISIAVPSYQGNTVSVIASDYETITNFSLAPIPEQKIIDNLGATTTAYKTNFSSQGNYVPQQIAQLSNIGMVKNWLTADVIVAPYQYNSREKTLKRYTRIVVRVDFGSKNFTFDQTDNDEWARVSLMNYRIAKRWVTPVRFAKSLAVNSVLASGTWIKMEVVNDGMYKIDAGYLRSVGIDPGSLSSITDVKIFGADGRNIPEDLNAVRPTDVPQLAVDYVDNNGNGKFNDDDYILFYGQGVTGWNYNASTKTNVHYVNPYTFSNYYFLSVGGTAPVKQMQTVNVPSIFSAKVTQTLGKVFFDEEKFNFNKSGQVWVSSPLNASESRSITNKLPGLAAGTSVRYHFRLYSRATAIATFTLEESGKLLSSITADDIPQSYLEDVVGPYAKDVEEQVATIPVLTDQRSNIKINYSVNSAVAMGFIDWIRIFYRQNLTALNDQIEFASPDTSGTIEFLLNGFSTNAVNIFEVSNANNIKKMSYRLEQTVGSMVFNDTLSSGSVKKYWIGTAAKYLSPKSSVRIPNSNLHGFNGADFIIMTHSDFKDEAIRLKNHKENLPGTKKLRTIVVDVDTIYNEFGIGIPDPIAVRDFLRYAVNNWSTKPKYVLFFGDASYDFRSIQKNDRSWVPSYQTVQSNDKISTFNNEDFLAYLDPNDPVKVSIAHGRLTPRSTDQARLLVDRIINYESKPTRGTWRNVITVVADDLWVGPGLAGESDHTLQAESLLLFYTPKDFEIQRIYEEEYPVVFISAGRRRPDARQAIIDKVNQGTLVLNYTGHGNPQVWAHESILTLDDVRNQFTNNDRLTFIVAATCDWGRFDEAGESSSAEEVMVNPKGGAIGVLSATRVVYSTENAATNREFYSKLFSGSSAIRLGDAYLLAKNALDSDLFALVNKQKYFLMGDPTLRLAVPEAKFTVDSLITASSTAADTLHALEKITIKGTVRDSLNAVDVNYNGSALINVFDADVRKTITTVPLTYSENGGIIYKGEASVRNGVVNASFIVPKDIAYQNKNGRLSVYFSNTQLDGRGYTRNFIVGGTNTNFPIDSAGPTISIYFDNSNFRSGDVVNENPVLIVSLKDSNGINSSSNSIGHRLEAWIDGNSKSIDLTESYKGNIDSYQQGTAEYQLSGLSQGSHSIKVRAWDVYNNSSSAESYFVVASSSSLSIQQLYNFPNPVSTTTAFTFQHNQLSPIDVTIHIYTIAGRRVHTIERFGVNDKFVKIGWNRRDSDGDEIGNGIYLYKVIARTVDGQFTSEAIGKLAVVR